MEGGDGVARLSAVSSQLSVKSKSISTIFNRGDRRGDENAEKSLFLVFYWGFDFTENRQLGTAFHHPIFDLRFVICATWCGPCHEYKASDFSKGIGPASGC